MNRTEDGGDCTEIKSPSGGSRIRLFEDRIELCSGSMSIYINGRDKDIRICAPGGEVLISGQQKVRVDATRVFEVKLNDAMEVSSPKVQVAATDAMTLRATSTIDLEAKSVKVNKDGLEVT